MMDICMQEVELYCKRYKNSVIEMDTSESEEYTFEKRLLVLDDMVISKVMRHLCLVDLVTLSETCARLGKIAKQHFEKHHSHVSWSNYQRTDRNTVKSSQCDKVFRHIGKHVKTVKLSYWENWEFYEILVALATQCTQIDTLILESIKMNRPFELCDPRVSPLFSRLKRFVLSGCVWVGFCPLNSFFGINYSLEQLSVINCCAQSGYSFKLHLTGFRALKQMRLLDCRNVLKEEELQGCFENNGITSLLLSNISEFNFFQGSIINGLHRTVTTLTLDYNSEINIDEFARLKYLKILRLRCHEFSDVDELLTKLGRNNHVLEELGISKIFISHTTIDALKNFKQLKYLKLECCINSVPNCFFISLPKILPQLENLVYTYTEINDDDIIYMFESMTNLRRLSLLGCNSLSSDSYMKMLDILKTNWRRPKLEFIPPKLETLKSLKCIENSYTVLQ